jgi:hypothetical protein
MPTVESNFWRFCFPMPRNGRERIQSGGPRPWYLSRSQQTGSISNRNEYNKINN